MFSKVNISIDDITPHPHSSDEVLSRCYELIKIFPEIKFTLFIPMAYYRTMPAPPQAMCKEPMRIDLYPEFCKSLLDLSDNIFELGYHGLYHGIPNKTNNDEFRDLSYDKAIEKFEDMEKICKRAGLYQKMKLIFRPPAWKMSADAIRAARDFGFEILAFNGYEPYAGHDITEASKKNDIAYSSFYPPWRKIDMVEKTGIVYHACDWDKNYLNENLKCSLIDFLKSSYEYEFCFMEHLL